MVGLLVWLGLAGQAVVVQGASQCPTPEAVSQRLKVILREPRQDARVVLRLDGSELRLTMVSATGQLLAERSLQISGSCDDMADAVSVIIAAWQARAPARSAASFALPASQPDRPQRVTAAVAKKLVRPRVIYDVGGAFVAAFAGSSFAPGALVDVGLGPAGSHFAARVALLGTSTRQQTVGSGHADWTRVSLVVGPRYRFWLKRFALELSADASFALLRTQGSGYDTNHVSYNFDPGLGASLRVGVRARSVMPFVGFGFTGWLRAQQVFAVNVAAAELPRWDALLSTGIAFGRFL